MSRLSNVSTLKIGIFRSWNNYWFDTKYYTNLLFSDLRIRDYLAGIFYKLKIISNYYYIYRLLNNKIVINTNLIFFSNFKFKSLSLKKVYKINPYIGFFYKKKYWFSFLRFLKMFNYFKNVRIFTHHNLYNIYALNNTMYYFLNVLMSLKSKILCLIASFYFNKLGSYFNRMVYYNRSILSKHSELSNVLRLLEYKKSISSLHLNYSVLYANHIYTNKQKSFNFFNDWYFLNVINNFMLSLFILIKFFYCYLSIPNYKYHTLLNLINLPYIKNQADIYTSINIDLNNHGASLLPNVFLKRTISKSLFKSLRYQIESSISVYTQQTVYFNFAINLKQNPYLNSAKIITDTLVYLLQSGQKIVKSFFFIRNWQSDCYITRRTLEHLYNSKYSSCLKQAKVDISYLFHYATKQSPLIGIRIECSGTFKKGKMSKVYFYNSWVKDDTLTGRMPNTSMIADIDYYQYVAVSKSSSLGVKTWIFLETHIYNNNHKYISLIY